MSITTPDASQTARRPVEWRTELAAGTPIAIGRIGTGYPVLCLHATGHDGDDFLPLAAHPACRGLAFLLVDWPGQGRSPPDATGAAASAWRYAEILQQIAGQASLAAPPVVLGNSIGGAAAITAAGSGRLNAAGLVLCNPGGLAPLDATSRLAIAALARFFRAGARGAPWFTQAFAAYYRLVLPRAAERRRHIVAAGPARAAILAEAWASFADPRADARAALRQIRSPVHFAWARDDRILAYARSRPAILESGASFASFRGGHAPFLEDLDAFAPDLRAFVNRVTAAAGRGNEASA